MSVRCPRCDGVIPEKIFNEIQEWGPEAMRCHYCGCPLNKSIFEKRRWAQLFPVPDKTEEALSHVAVRKSKQVAQRLKKSATEFKNDYFG